MIAWLGFRQVGVEYVRRPRLAGESKAPFRDLVVLVFNAVTSLARPLRLFTAFGFFVLASSVVAACFYAVFAFAGDPPPGITTLIVLAWAAIGINALGIGILGEYVGRTYAEVKRRPLYVVEETVNLSVKEGGARSVVQASANASGAR
jgi:hypothetical protein